MILLVGGEKGGTGKTTLATNLAAVRALAGRDVLLIDTDPQMSASDWVGFRDEGDVSPRVASTQLYEPSLKQQIPDFARRYEDIIIDAGGRDSAELRRALAVADVALFPVQPSQYDVLTIKRLAQLVERAREVNERLVAYVVINRAPTNPRTGETEAAQEATGDFPSLRLAATIVRDRIAFRRSASLGLSAIEYQPADEKAVAEIQSLYSEIYTHDR